MINDPYIEKQFTAVQKAMSVDPVQGRQLNNRESIIYRIEKAWSIPLPEPFYYVLWKPWLKGFNGTFEVAHSQDFSWPRYFWIDQELKETMGR